jgi:glycogen debranching enzyme
MEFEDYRLPELFTGFARKDYGAPVRYPVACHPQAWAAGSFPFLVETSLGLVPEGFDNRLRVIRPSLPECVNDVIIRHLKVGRGAVDLRFLRQHDGSIEVQVVNVAGTLSVEIEQ